MKYSVALAAMMTALSVTAATPRDTPAGEQRFRDLYRELVETNTTLSAGNCTLAAQFWPGVPVLPILQAGATDAEFTSAVGIPTYGVEPVFVGPDLGKIHGLNEHVGVQSLLEGREFLYRLIKV